MRHPYKLIGKMDLSPPDGLLLLDVDPKDGKRWFLPCPMWAEVGVCDDKFGLVIRNNHRIISEQYNLDSVKFHG